MDETLKLIRYNTGTDKKVLIDFKDYFSAVIFNATIVAYSKSAVADLIAVHKNRYIIDPQTHIYQQDLTDVQTTNKYGQLSVKKSVDQYLSELPSSLKNKYYSNNGNLSPSDIFNHIDELVDKVYDFGTHFVDDYIQKKEYDKYLRYAKIGPSPAVIIAPYFMLKSSYSYEEILDWMRLNSLCINKFASINNDNHRIGVQIVIDKKLMESYDIATLIKEYYSDITIDYAFIWIDDFNLFEAPIVQKERFKLILKSFTDLNIRPIMAYGGYESIILCNKDIPYRLYGVAQSVGYGETRPITPVGGGIPVNKYYFPPLHTRLQMSEVTTILANKDYFALNKREASELFYKNICNCKQCQSVIKNDIDNFLLYNESNDFTMRNGIKRNRPTSNASYIAANHFMYSKVNEWIDVENKSFKELKDKLIIDHSTYSQKRLKSLKEWIRVYE